MHPKAIAYLRWRRAWAKPCFVACCVVLNPRALPPFPKPLAWPVPLQSLSQPYLGERDREKRVGEGFWCMWMASCTQTRTREMRALLLHDEPVINHSTGFFAFAAYYTHAAKRRD